MLLVQNGGVNGAVNALILQPLRTFSQRHPAVVGVWLAGLLLLFFADGYRLSPQQERDFDASVASVDWAALERARVEAEISYLHYYDSKGWFWQCDSVCTRNYELHRHKAADYELLKGRAEQTINAAKARLGLFSERGIDETRSMLFDRVQRGNEFAKSMSWYDAIFFGIESMGRDEGIFGYLLRLIIQVIFNFFFALVGSMISFLWGVGKLIHAFQASLPEAMLLFCGCLCVAASVLLSFCLGVYLVGTTTVIGVTQIAALSAANQPRNRHLR